MEELTDEQKEKQEYIKDLKTLAAAQAYIKKVFGEEEAIDYMISECKNYATSGRFSNHCYEYANKELPPLTEEEIEKALPKNWAGKPIWGYQDANRLV